MFPKLQSQTRWGRGPSTPGIREVKCKPDCLRLLLCARFPLVAAEGACLGTIAQTACQTRPAHVPPECLLGPDQLRLATQKLTTRDSVCAQDRDPFRLPLPPAPAHLVPPHKRRELRGRDSQRQI